MGDVIKDFYKSDAPQFRGRSKEKRREMAIAAKLTAERGEQVKEQEEMPMSAAEIALQKRKARIQMMIAKKRQQTLQTVDKDQKKEEVEHLDEMPYQVYGSPDGKKEKKIGKPVKSRKYADARAAELADTHKKTGGKYRSEYTEEVVNEEEADRLRDRRMERGGVDGNTDYRRPPAKKATNAELGIKPGKTAVQKELEKKHGKGKSAMDIVRAEIRAKHGKGSVK